MAPPKSKCLNFLGLTLTVLAIGSARAVDELKCELITVSACQNLVYNMTVASAPMAMTNGSGNSTGEHSESPGIRSQLDAELLVSVLLRKKSYQPNVNVVYGPKMV